MEKTKNYSVAVILTCAGKGERAGLGVNKLLYPVGGTNALLTAIKPFKENPRVNEIIVTASESDYDEIRALLPHPIKVVVGGATRTDSVKNALEVTESQIVLIHDGARPFTHARIINDCIDGVINFGSAITCIPTRDTICLSNGQEISSYCGKSGLYLVQTPQAFFTQDVKRAYEKTQGVSFNDDGEVYLKTVKNPHIVLGDAKNIKITYGEDLSLLNSAPLCRIGTGFDCHKLVEGRKLILGGIEIPHEKGLLGHSDADVLTHAVMDAMLSAVAMRDIGYHFSDKDAQYKDIDSTILLKKVLKMLDDGGYKVNNVSATIMAEKPKLLAHVPTITKNLADIIGISESQIGIGATTLEKLGFVGREEGICVQATCTVIAK